MTLNSKPGSQYIGGFWSAAGGMPMASRNPANGQLLWEGLEADPALIDGAVNAARSAFADWSRRPYSERERLLLKYQEILTRRKPEITNAISQEVGKPRWEAGTEAQAMIGKIPLAMQAYGQRTSNFGSGAGITRFKPHGVVAVFGPYNFPGHLPNGQIVPALLAGNTIVFKPSEQAPAVAELMMVCLEEAGIPGGVVNMVQGGRETGQGLADHPGLDGLFFTGSARTGLILHELFAGRPDKILALELGGNNPLVVQEVDNLDAAAFHTTQSAYLTSGQRCTCARRLIVPEGSHGDAFVERLVGWINRLTVGDPLEDPEPFMGSLISHEAAVQVLNAQEQRQDAGGQSLVEARILKPGSGIISPALIDVTGVHDLPDEEIFGPLLHLIRVPDFEAAIEAANDTAYGLSAGLLSDNKVLYDQFYTRVRAGLINWNQQITGASGAAPFGGVGLSGNHRPSGFFASDFCAYPVASIEREQLSLPESLPQGIRANENTN